MTEQSAREFYGASAVTAAEFEAETGCALPDVACVQLDDEQVAIVTDEEGVVMKCQLRVLEDGKERPLTRDEELAFAAAPGTSAEREAATQRVDVVGMKLALRPLPWKPDDFTLIAAQIERQSVEHQN